MDTRYNRGWFQIEVFFIPKTIRLQFFDLEMLNILINLISELFKWIIISVAFHLHVELGS